MTNVRECEVAEQFLKRADEASFDALFRVFSPQLLAFFRRRGHETGVAEDLAQEVMLTDPKVRQAKPKSRPYKLADGKGLYLYVSPKGAKSWRYDYRVHGKRETLTVGAYPEVTLGEAREAHQEARSLVERGESPSPGRRRPGTRRGG